MSAELWIILIGVLASWSCTLCGMWLVLGRFAMVGDAISHTVLLGIVGSFLLTGIRSSFAFSIGAIVVGVLTALGTRWLKEHASITHESSLGICYTTLFALGILLLSTFARGVDIDQECVLYGDLLMAPFKTFVINGFECGPESFWALGAVLLCNVVTLWIGWRPLSLVCFDPAGAKVAGVNVRKWETILMALTSLTAVVAFEAVGALLVVALLVLPAATGILIASSLHQLLFIALIVGVVSSGGGHFLSQAFDSSPAPGMSVCAGVCFSIVFGVQQLFTRGKRKNFVVK